MTTIGAFARMFPRPDAAAVAATMATTGYGAAHVNLAAFGLPSLPDGATRVDYADLVRTFVDAGVAFASLSATFNAIDVDTERRARSIARVQRMIAGAAGAGIDVVTLCTGSRSEDMWTWHPENASAAAWSDLRATLDALIPVAREHGVVLAIEPERGNVVSDAARAGRLLGELGDDATTIGIILDPANLVTVATAHDQERILTEAFADLGGVCVAVHAKDVVPAGAYAAAGCGALDYELIAGLHAAHSPDAPVIVQDAREDDAARVLHLLNGLGWG